MKLVKLKSQPKVVPENMSVEDYDIGGGKFARIILEMVNNGSELILQGQAYEVDKTGKFVPAPNGYPSRSSKTSHTVSVDDFGKRISMNDSWGEHSMNFDPDSPDNPEVGILNGPPTKDGEEYGDLAYDRKNLRAYKWNEGLATLITRTKIEDLLQILKSSDALSGMAFKKRSKS